MRAYVYTPEKRATGGARPNPAEGCARSFDEDSQLARRINESRGAEKRARLLSSCARVAPMTARRQKFVSHILDSPRRGGAHYAFHSA